MNTFNLKILAADSPFYDGDCLSVRIPTSEGYYGVMANHRSMIAAIVPGEIKFTLPDGEVRYAAISAGILKIEGSEVLVLTETAEAPEDIDANRAAREAEQAKEEMLSRRSIRDYNLAQAQLARALNRMKVKSNHTLK